MTASAGLVDVTAPSRILNVLLPVESEIARAQRTIA